MNRIEYEWVKQTREILLKFCDELQPEDFTRHIDGFGFQSVRDSLLHVANCYHGWLGSYILLQTKTPLTPKENISKTSLEEIKQRFIQADAYVDDVLNDLDGQMDELIIRAIPWREHGEPISISAAQLLLHVVTHEYHHKGQIMAMARHMGYEPPNTDVLGVGD
ncbi:DinB family protein [Fictibacillus sp. WQ 8-8]|uniref:DinB family protein n=1 Tax=unclassified Fictibacillus TaxID=2644029 RepID=UPI0006A7E604|nr:MULTISPECIES: DinB family protein [unclassified Fictibacillus]MCQ6267356.1 DinB family protein [Fictibacillus sp. WQ 8-8]UZJ76862.1 DinB family protein [Fictibacillus sp. KU28468]